jgi:hypothetical protein
MQAEQVVGADFYGTHIPGKHYGTALSLTRFLIGSDGKKYGKFFVCLKAGMSEEDALVETYGVRRDVLIAEYGQKLGIANLRSGIGK